MKSLIRNKIYLSLGLLGISCLLDVQAKETFSLSQTSRVQASLASAVTRKGARKRTFSDSTKVKYIHSFQGLWQQRKGHSIYFDYGYQTGALAYKSYRNYMTYKPIRFDLSYQYDIPWNPKRINFYAHAGLGIRRLKTDYKPYYNYLYQGPLFLLPEFEKGVVAYAGIGMKIHCTDWLHLAFSEALNVMHEVGHGDFIGEGERFPEPPGWKHTLVGLQSSFRLVGQVKGFSIYAGYRLDHWLKTYPNTLEWPCSLTRTDKNGKYEGYLTIGVGYAF